MTQEEQWLLKEKYGGEETDGFLADCARLKAGEPLAYIIGHIPFLGTMIHLDSHPLIPRPETEYWVERAIREMRCVTRPIRVLDLCAGSGCIGTAVLKSLHNTSVDFIEREERHHATILNNVIGNGIDHSRARVLGGSLFEHAEGFYDFILSNPPYLNDALRKAAPEVIRFEPREALVSGERGLDAITQIIATCPSFLTPSGVLYIEHEPEQAPFLASFAAEHGLCTSTESDQYGVWRYSRITRIQCVRYLQSHHFLDSAHKHVRMKWLGQLCTRLFLFHSR